MVGVGGRGGGDQEKNQHCTSYITKQDRPYTHTHTHTHTPLMGLSTQRKVWDTGGFNHGNQSTYITFYSLKVVVVVVVCVCVCCVVL
jgi:hypothetical protein